jgi:hypothetical protein
MDQSLTLLVVLRTIAVGAFLTGLLIRASPEIVWVQPGAGSGDVANRGGAGIATGRAATVHEAQAEDCSPLGSRRDPLQLRLQRVEGHQQVPQTRRGPLRAVAPERLSSAGRPAPCQKQQMPRTPGDNGVPTPNPEKPG